MDDTEALFREASTWNWSDPRSYAIPPLLDALIIDIARSGQCQLDWARVHLLIKVKMSKMVDEFFQVRGFTGPITETFSSRKCEIFELWDTFVHYPPFTLQRLCEVLVEADRQYRSTYALLNGLGKILSVSTVISS